MALIIAHTKYGDVKGLSLDADSVTVFKGIPFAMPPTGELRWKAPRRPNPWDGVRTAYDFKPIPVQEPWPEWESSWGLMSCKKSEDCLYLNIWTPAENQGERLPVLIFIQGGAYKTGAGSAKIYDGEMIAKRGCLVVTFNYRVGPFGFWLIKNYQAKIDVVFLAIMEYWIRLPH